MSKTLGFYILEKCMRKYQCWPTSRWFRSLRPAILIIVNIIWTLYPAVLEIINYKMYFVQLLFHMEFAMMGAVVISNNTKFLRNRHYVFKMINLLSDFNQYDIPQRIKFIDRNMKTVLKTIRYGGFLIGYLMTYYIMFENNCARIMNTKLCLVIEYYIPFDLKQWQMTLMMLFQIYTLGITTYIIFIGLVLYTYSFELLIVRIENLKDMIDNNINLTRNKKRNFKLLRPVLLYHQDILRIFHFVNKVFTSFLIPTKVCTLVCLTMSTTEFVLKKNLISFFMVIMNFSGLLLTHITGQRFTAAADSVAEAVYNLNWYDADVKTRKDILTFLCMSQKTLTIQVPIFGQLSHTAAAKEFKTVYVFYSWILKVTKQRNL